MFIFLLKIIRQVFILVASFCFSVFAIFQGKVNVDTENIYSEPKFWYIVGLTIIVYLVFNMISTKISKHSR